jgi:hypothetical protein
MVLQMAIVHVIIFLVLNIVSTESPATANEILIFFVPFIALTIILGVWAFQITIRMISPYYAHLKLLKKFIAFQLCLIFCKLQPLLLNVILNVFFEHLISRCAQPFSKTVTIRSKSKLNVSSQLIDSSIPSNHPSDYSS